MSTINLIIGGVDVSENVGVNTYRIKKTWKLGTEFTGYDGKDVKSYTGYYYEISTALDDIPDELMSRLITALDSDTVEVTFTDPHSAAGTTTADFLRGESTGGEVAYELDDGLYWNLSITLKTELVPSSGGGL